MGLGVKSCVVFCWGYLLLFASIGVGQYAELMRDRFDGLDCSMLRILKSIACAVTEDWCISGGLSSYS
jgi:hypothetical protein